MDEIKRLISHIKEDNADRCVGTSKSSARPEVAFGENPSFSSASAGIEMKYASQRGRYVVANRDIKRGQILYVEKAFAFVPVNRDKIDVLGNICHNCCQPCSDTPAP